MCLLIVGSSNAVRAQLLHTAGLIEDIYGSNEDGVGLMYATAKSQIKVVKRLPKDASGFRDLVAAMPTDDRQVALHARMRTHGDIDMDNCHPYQINDASWYMHNGILHTGNDADRSKSDTWHFARDYLADLSPDALHSPGMLKLLGDFIDNNRFAILSADGRLSVVNREQGIEHDGVWYSNTYAWSPELLIPGYAKRRKSTYGGFGRYGSWGGRGYGPLLDDEDELEGFSFYGRGAGSAAAAQAAPDADDHWTTTVDTAIADYDVSLLGALLEDDATRAVVVSYILDSYEITAYVAKGHDSAEYADVPDRTRAAAKAWRNYEDDTIVALAQTTPHSVAEALMYYCDLEPCPQATVGALDPAEQDDDAEEGVAPALALVAPASVA